VTHQGTPGGGDPKRPYGGLVPSQPKGTRAYQDAATYNHHLAQHQAYTAQAQAASQAATAFRNPYITPQNSQPPPQVQTTTYSGADSANPAYPQHNHGQYSSNQSGQRLAHQASSGQLEAVGSAAIQYAQGAPPNTHLNPNVPAGSYYPNTRVRANTINQMKDVPAALARLQRMDNNMSRNALTPVLNRDDAMQEWERRQSGKPSTVQSYPQIEFLQQQAEMAAASGSMNWGHTKNRYPPPPSGLSHTYHPQTIMVDDDRREAVMSNVRSAARNEGPVGMYASSGTGVISNPPQAYASNATTSGNRYATTYSQPQQQSGSLSFEPVDRRTDMGNVYAPMQPDQYPSYSNPPVPTTRHVAVPPQTVAPSFYGAGVSAGQAPTSQQQQRNPFSVPDSLQSMSGAKDTRRGGNMDSWQR
jgi:dual specificity protein kinase YAK1